MGGSVTQTLVVSNTGTVAFDFTASVGAAWASVSPANGTLDPGPSMNFSVVFDSAAAGGVGDYTDAITFNGTFNNSPNDVDLLLHVTGEQDYYIYLPVMIRNSDGSANGTAALPWLVPLVGLTAVAAVSRRKK
jgi:hypothetical protein